MASGPAKRTGIISGSLSRAPYKKIKSASMSILPSQVGEVVGRMGAIIKSMEVGTGAKMWIDTDTNRNRPSVEITGQRSQIRAALRLVCDLLGKDPKKVLDSDGSDSDPEDSEPFGIAELTVNRNKFKLTNLDRRTKEKDILSLYPDAKANPKILMRGVEATCMFANDAEPKIWVKKIDGRTLLKRTIAFRK